MGIAVTRFAPASGSDSKQTVAHGLPAGEVPVALIFFRNNDDAAGTWAAHLDESIGVWDGSSHRCVATGSIDGQTSTRTERLCSTTKVMASVGCNVGVDNAVIFWTASVLSTDDTNVVLSYSQASLSSLGTCGLVAIGGADALSKIVGHTMKTSLSPDGIVPVTGAGFPPDLIVNIWAGDDSATENTALVGGRMGFGVACRDGTQAALSHASQDGVGTSASGRRTSNTSCVNQCSTTGSLNSAAGITSMDSDGFTVTYSAAAAAAAPVYSLCLKNVQAELVTQAKKNGAGLQPITGAGFAPDAGVFFGASLAVATTAANAGLGLGAASGTGSAAKFAMTGQDRDGLGTSDSNAYGNAKAFASMQSYATSQGTVNEADLNSFDTDGATLNWTTSDSSTAALFALFLKIRVPVTTDKYFPRTEIGEANTANNDKLGDTAPSSGSDGTCAFSTTATLRYILLKPGVSGTTTPNQTADPSGIASQGFGWDILIAEKDRGPSTAKRKALAGVWNFQTKIAYSAGDTAVDFSTVCNVYRRNTNGTYTFLFSAKGTDAAVGAVGATLTCTYSSTSQPEYTFAQGETVHVEFWLHGRGGGTLGATAQTATFNIESGVFVQMPSPGFRTTWLKSLLGTITPAGAKTLKKVLKLLGTITPAGVLTTHAMRRKSLSGTVPPAGALATHSIRRKSLAGTVTPAGTLLRKAIARRSGTITPAGALRRKITARRSGTVTPAGTLVKKTKRTFVGTITSAGAVVVRSIRRKSLAGTITPAGILTKKTKRPLAGTVTPSGTLKKKTKRTFAGTVTSVGSLVTHSIRRKSLSGSITPTGTLTRKTKHNVAGALRVGGLLTRKTQVRRSGTVTPSGSLKRRTKKFLAGTITPTGVLTTNRIKDWLWQFFGPVLKWARSALMRKWDEDTVRPQDKWTASGSSSKWKPGTPKKKWHHGPAQINRRPR